MLKASRVAFFPSSVPVRYMTYKNNNISSQKSITLPIEDLRPPEVDIVPDIQRAQSYVGDPKRTFYAYRSTLGDLLHLNQRKNQGSETPKSHH